MEQIPTKIPSIPIHSEFILNGLKILKTNNILCDVVLIAEGKML